MLWSTQTQLGSQFLEIHLNISSMHLGEKNMHCSTAFHLNSMQGSWFWKKTLNRGKWSLKKNMHFLPHDYLTPIYLSPYILLHPKTLLVFPSQQLHYSFAYFTNTWHACIYKIFKRNSWGLPLVHYLVFFFKFVSLWCCFCLALGIRFALLKNMLFLKKLQAFSQKIEDLK